MSAPSSLDAKTFAQLFSLWGLKASPEEIAQIHKLAVAMNEAAAVVRAPLPHAVAPATTFRADKP